jgi:hypothetical protein
LQAQQIEIATLKAALDEVQPAGGQAVSGTLLGGSVTARSSLMLSKKSEDLTRYYAAEALLNRGWGRPATAITREGDTGPAKVELTVVNEFYP